MGIEMKKAVAVIALIGVATAAQARTMTLSEKRAVESVVRDHLKDPRSAIFKHPDVQISAGSQGAIYCGVVNSKNSYGGYTGNAMFMAGFFTNTKSGKPITKAEFVSMGDADPNSEDSQVMVKLCEKVPTYTG